MSDVIRKIQTPSEKWDEQGVCSIGELQLSTAIKKILNPSDNCDETGTILYNLDAIISVGYRVNSYEATQFRLQVTHEEAEAKALGEYEKFWRIQDLTIRFR